MNHHILKYYKVLGINPTDDEQIIKKAYRRKAFRFHPDRNPSPVAHQKFLEITEAYEILTGQRKLSIETIYRPRTKEEILAEKIQVARSRYEQMIKEERQKDERYYRNIAFGWKWKLFQLGAFYGLVFTMLLSIDYFSVSEHRTIDPRDIWYNPINHSILIENAGERFSIPDQEFWHFGRTPIRANYSYLFHDLKSVSVIISPIDKWDKKKHSYRMRDLADFDDFQLNTHLSSASIYAVFPFLHFFLIVPFLLVIFKRPTLRFAIWRLVSIWIIFPVLLFFTLSNDRIFHLFGWMD